MTCLGVNCYPSLLHDGLHLGLLCWNSRSLLSRVTSSTESELWGESEIGKTSGNNTKCKEMCRNVVFFLHIYIYIYFKYYSYTKLYYMLSHHRRWAAQQPQAAKLAASKADYTGSELCFLLTSGGDKLELHHLLNYPHLKYNSDSFGPSIWGWVKLHDPQEADWRLVFRSEQQDKPNEKPPQLPGSKIKQLIQDIGAEPDILQFTHITINF